MTRVLMIGDLASATGTKVNTIRFYEEIGLMRRAARTPSGRRTYDDAAVGRLRFIRRARKLGFDTDEIRALLALSDEPNRQCEEVSVLAQKHRSAIEAKIEQLEQLRDELGRIARSCAGGTVADCRILEALSGPGV